MKEYLKIIDEIILLRMIIFGYIKIFDETIEKTPKYDIII